MNFWNHPCDKIKDLSYPFSILLFLYGMLFSTVVTSQTPTLTNDTAPCGFEVVNEFLPYPISNTLTSITVTDSIILRYERGEIGQYITDEIVLNSFGNLIGNSTTRLPRNLPIISIIKDDRIISAESSDSAAISLVQTDIEGQIITQSTYQLPLMGEASNPSATSLVFRNGVYYIAGIYVDVTDGMPTFLYYLIKTDVDGNLISSNSYPTEEFRSPIIYDVDTQDNIYLGYQTSSRTGHVFKITADSIVWDTPIIGDLVSNRIESVQLSEEEQAIYLAVFSDPKASVRKLDTETGEFIWNVRPGELFSDDGDFTVQERLQGLLLTDDGGIIVGYPYMSTNDTRNRGFEYGKLDQDGNPIWWKRLTDREYRYDFYVPELETQDGSILFTGPAFRTSRQADSLRFGILKVTATGELTPDCAELSDPCVAVEGIFNFNSQAELDAFGPCEKIIGAVAIVGDDITNVDALQGVKEITGGLFIRQTASSLVSLEGLSDLEIIGDAFEYIGFNREADSVSVPLTNLDLPNLRSLGRKFMVSGSALESISVPKLETIGDVLQLIGPNNDLEIIDFPSLQSVEGNIVIAGANELQDLSGFAALTSIGEFLVVTLNENLTTLTGLENLETVGDGSSSTVITLTNNPQLGDCCVVLELLEQFGADRAVISDNALDCADLEAVQENCTTDPPIIPPSEGCGYQTISSTQLYNSPELSVKKVVREYLEVNNQIQVTIKTQEHNARIINQGVSGVAARIDITLDESGDLVQEERIPSAFVDNTLVESMLALVRNDTTLAAVNISDAYTLGDTPLVLGSYLKPTDNGVDYFIFAIRLDQSGQVVWRQDYQRTIETNPFVSTVDAQGGFYIRLAQINRSTNVMKINSEGIFQWEINVARNLTAIIPSTDGQELYLSYTNDGFPIARSKKYDANTGQVIYSKVGNLLSENTEQPQEGTVYGFLPLPDQGAIVTIGLPDDNKLQYGKIDGNGNKVWSKEIDRRVFYRPVLATSDGGYFFAGLENGILSFFKTTSTGELAPDCIPTTCDLLNNETFDPCNPLVSEIAIYEYQGATYLVAFADGTMIADLPTVVRSCDTGEEFCLFGFVANPGPCIAFFEEATKLTTVLTKADNCFECTCADIEDPVCGEDGVTYPNSCEAECAGVAWKAGPCPDEAPFIDLELGISTPNPNPAIYTRLPLTVQVTNKGNIEAENIKIDLTVCGANSSGFQRSANIVYATTAFTASIGAYNYLEQVWTLPNLEAGADATLTIELFTLSEDPINIGAFVFEASPDDIDSTPDFIKNVGPCEIDEDDEADLVLNGITLCDCPEVLNPVCGSDGLTYDNACEAECVGVTYVEGSCTLPSGEITCGEITVSYKDGTIDIIGQRGAEYFFKVHRRQPVWEYVFECNGKCGFGQTVSNLTAGTYYVDVYDKSWHLICDDIEVVMEGGAFTGDIGHQTVNSRMSPSSIAVRSNKAIQSLKVYPNPANHSVMLEVPTAIQGAGQVYILDKLGRLVQSISFDTIDAMPISLSQFDNGVYQIQIVIDGELVGKEKLVIVR